MTAGIRLRVDPIACDGRRLCAELLPELISLDDWGFPMISDGEVPVVLLAEARETVRICPKLALRLEVRGDEPRAGDRLRDRPGAPWDQRSHG